MFLNKLMDKEDRVYVYVKWNITQPLKEPKFAYLEDMDGPRRLC